MEENDKYRILIDPQDFQKIILEYINTGEVDKIFDCSEFVGDKKCKQAMIYGMHIASVLTSLCEPTILRSR